MAIYILNLWIFTTRRKVLMYNVLAPKEAKNYVSKQRADVSSGRVKHLLPCASFTLEASYHHAKGVDERCIETEEEAEMEC